MKFPLKPIIILSLLVLLLGLYYIFYIKKNIEGITGPNIQAVYSIMNADESSKQKLDKIRAMKIRDKNIKKILNKDTEDENKLSDITNYLKKNLVPAKKKK